jgi:integration host factor subunit beta
MINAGVPQPGSLERSSVPTPDGIAPAMTKSELIDALATRRKVARVTAEEVVNLVFDRMREALTEDERIEIRGFGSFKVRRYPGYVGRNPKTQEAMPVAPKALPKFKVSKQLRAIVNGGSAGGKNAASQKSASADRRRPAPARKRIDKRSV